ncbi:MAG: preprotein translocase subunit YajC [Kineosporiaceae bacterium]
MDRIAPLLILALPLLMLFWLSSRARRQQREVAAVSASLAVGQRVMTSSGLHGVITELGEETADLLVAPGVVTRWDRRAIVRALGSEHPPEPAAAAPPVADTVRADTEPAADPDPPGVGSPRP